MKLIKFIALILSLGCLPFTAALRAQDPSDTPVRDPLTGEIIEPEDPGPVRADLSQANELVREQKYAEAESVLAELQGDFPEDPALLMMRGELLNALRRPDEAIEVLEATRGIDPDRPRLCFHLASALAAVGRDDEAIEAFGEELERSEETQVLALARLNRAVLLQKNERWAEAAAELEAVLVLEPHRTPVYGELVRLYLQLDDLNAAVDALDRGQIKGYRSAAHWYSVGARAFKEGDYERAVELFRRSIEIDAASPDPHRSLAEALVRLERDPEAVAHFEHYLKLKPEADDAEQVRAEIDRIGKS